MLKSIIHNEHGNNDFFCSLYYKIIRTFIKIRLEKTKGKVHL